MLSPDVLSRYLKIWALTTRGVSGERETAQRRLEEMQKRYPGIHRIAEAIQNATSSSTDTPPPASMDRGVWEMLKTVASAAFEMMDSSAGMEAGQVAARRVKPHVELGANAAGRPVVVVGVTFGSHTISRLLDLDPIELEGFRNAAAQTFFAALDAYLEEGLDEDDLD